MGVRFKASSTEEQYKPVLLELH